VLTVEEKDVSMLRVASLDREVALVHYHPPSGDGGIRVSPRMPSTTNSVRST
jgi:hypothetical protein